MPLTEELLSRLRCPETKQPLALSDDAAMERIRSATTEPVEAALIRQDGKRAYPIRDGFPILLLDEAITLDQ